MKDALSRDHEKPHSPPLRIDVLTEDSISAQAGAYAEYRVFAALTQQSPGAPVRHARVVLRRTSSDAGSEAVVCTVTVAFEDSESMKIRTTGDHAYAAINRAVDRLKLARSADLPGGRGYNPRAS
jgi:ribosome-associated translation inhibitor RaiA